MTPREEAIARLKTIQDKFQAAPGGLPADQVSSLHREFMEGVVKVLSETPAPAVAPATRKLRFEGIGGDRAYRNAEMFSTLPKDVAQEWDKCYILGSMLRKAPQDTDLFKRLVNGSDEFKKAMDTGTSGEGSEWVPTGLSSQLLEEVTQMGGVEMMHPHLAMPTNPYEVPIQTARLTSYKASEQTASTGQTGLTKSPVTSISNKLTLTAVDLAVEVLASKNLSEDSIVPILNFLRAEIVKALSRGTEECSINGDTTATHMDTDIEAAGATDRRTLWKGYRKLALENSYSIDFQASGNSFDYETWLKVRAKHGKYGINPADLFWLVSLNTFFQSLSLKDANGQAVVTTIDKLGAQATALTGVLGFLAGSPVAVSEFCRDDLNASGVNDGVTTDRSAILSVQKSGFVFGDRRDASIQLLTELYAEYQQDALLSVIRKTFAPWRPIASNAAVAIGYNIPTA